jgi:hypothetical protein
MVPPLVQLELAALLVELEELEPLLWLAARLSQASLAA